MKNIILTAAAIFAFGFANAQTKVETTTTTTTTTEGGKGFSAGSMFMTGAVGFSSDTQADAKDNTFTIAPSFGFFVVDNIAIGARVGYTNETTNGGGLNEEDRKYNTLTAGAFARYYCHPASDFSFFAELAANYHGTTRDHAFGDDTKFNGFNVALSPGISYFVSSHFALEASIGAISYDTNKDHSKGVTNADAENNFNIGLDLRDVSVGVVFKF